MHTGFSELPPAYLIAQQQAVHVLDGCDEHINVSLLLTNLQTPGDSAVAGALSATNVSR